MNLIKIKTHQTVGKCKVTEIDGQKAAADIIIKQVGPYVVDSKVDLKGRGIKKMSAAGRYQVSEGALNKLHGKYTVVTDF